MNSPSRTRTYNRAVNTRSLYQLSYRGTNHENQRLTLNKPFSSESIQGIMQFSRPLSRPAIFLARSCKISLQHWIYARCYYILAAFAKLKWIAIRFDMEMVLLGIQGNLRRN